MKFLPAEQRPDGPSLFIATYYVYERRSATGGEMGQRSSKTGSAATLRSYS